MCGVEEVESLVFLFKVIDSQFLTFVHRSRSEQKIEETKKGRKKKHSWVPGGRQGHPGRRGGEK